MFSAVERLLLECVCLIRIWRVRRSLFVRQRGEQVILDDFNTYHPLELLVANSKLFILLRSCLFSLLLLLMLLLLLFWVILTFGVIELDANFILCTDIVYHRTRYWIIFLFYFACMFHLRSSLVYVSSRRHIYVSSETKKGKTFILFFF